MPTVNMKQKAITKKKQTKFTFQKLEMFFKCPLIAYEMVMRHKCSRKQLVCIKSKLPFSTCKNNNRWKNILNATILYRRMQIKEMNIINPSEKCTVYIIYLSIIQSIFKIFLLNSFGVHYVDPMEIRLNALFKHQVRGRKLQFAMQNSKQNCLFTTNE